MEKVLFQASFGMASPIAYVTAFMLAALGLVNALL